MSHAISQLHQLVALNQQVAIALSKFSLRTIREAVPKAFLLLAQKKNITLNFLVDSGTYDDILELQSLAKMNRSELIRSLVQREKTIIRTNEAGARPVASPDIEQFFRDVQAS